MAHGLYAAGSHRLNRLTGITIGAIPSVLPFSSVTRIDHLRLPALLLLYFGFHVLTRSLVSSNLQLDEAEQVVLAQDWL